MPHATNADPTTAGDHTSTAASPPVPVSARSAVALARSAQKPRRAAHPADRVVALDFARLLALVGMMTAHLLISYAGVEKPAPVSSFINDEIAAGNPSTLFAVLGGFSLLLAAASRLRGGDRRGAVFAAIVRGAIIVLIGLALGMLPSLVIVVLVPFGVALMLAAPFLLVPNRVIAIVAAVLLVVGSTLNHLVSWALTVPAYAVASAASSASSASSSWASWSSAGSFDDSFELSNVNLSFRSFADPFGLATDVLFTGTYPIVTWLGYLLVGLLCARLMMRAIERDDTRRFALRLLLVGTAAAMVSRLVSNIIAVPLADAAAVAASSSREPGFVPQWFELLLADPHTGTPGDMLATGGVALAVIGALLFACSWRTRPIGPVLGPLRSAGAAPLTIYSMHVALVAAALALPLDRSPGAEAAEVLSSLWLHLGLALLLGIALYALRRRGPLEALLAKLTSLIVPVGRRRRAGESPTA